MPRYDYFDPRDLTTRSRPARGVELFFAARFNGTRVMRSAGRSACRHQRAATACGSPRGSRCATVHNLGVLVDDLTTQPREPSHFTSRADIACVREDKADARLTPLGRELGLFDDGAGDRQRQAGCHRTEAARSAACTVRAGDVPAEGTREYWGSCAGARRQCVRAAAAAEVDYPSLVELAVPRRIFRRSMHASSTARTGAGCARQNRATRRQHAEIDARGKHETADGRMTRLRPSRPSSECGSAREVRTMTAARRRVQGSHRRRVVVMIP